jgi:hypothetical protein
MALVSFSTSFSSRCSLSAHPSRYSCTLAGSDPVGVVTPPSGVCRGSASGTRHFCSSPSTSDRAASTSAAACPYSRYCIAGGNVGTVVSPSVGTPGRHI